MKKALLEFFLSEVNLYLFIVRSDLPEYEIEDKEPLVFELQINSSEIMETVEKIRKSIIEGKSYKLSDVSEIDTSYLQSLGDKIFTKEIRNSLEHYDALYIVPFGELHYLPIHALAYDNEYLIDRFVVSYLPSASLLPHIKVDNQFSSNLDLLAIGVDYKDEKGVFRKEADQIGKLPFWKNKTILKRSKATKANILSELNNKKAIHFSTHGYFSTYEPLHSGLVLYTNEGDIKLSERENTELIFSAKDFIEYGKIDSELVVLSGCVTGQSENRPGDELIGLSRGLIFAGVKSMIIALFPTFKNIEENDHTRFSSFYKFWIEGSMGKAQAFREYIRSIKSTPAFTHPFYWFSYIYIGSLDD